MIARPCKLPSFLLGFGCYLCTSQGACTFPVVNKRRTSLSCFTHLLEWECGPEFYLFSSGGGYVLFCAVIQYLNLVGTGIGYTVTAGLSMT